MKHAIVQRDGFTVPLIGIPPEATLYECDLCHNTHLVGDLELNPGGNQFLCEKCRKYETHPQ
jgi:hypothetical protein